MKLAVLLRYAAAEMLLILRVFCNIPPLCRICIYNFCQKSGIHAEHPWARNPQSDMLQNLTHFKYQPGTWGVSGFGAFQIFNLVIRDVWLVMSMQKLQNQNKNSTSQSFLVLNISDKGFSTHVTQGTGCSFCPWVLGSFVTDQYKIDITIYIHGLKQRGCLTSPMLGDQIFFIHRKREYCKVLVGGGMCHIPVYPHLYPRWGH